MVERDTNTRLIYPVSDRTEETLLPIIERHVEKDATIYSDGWSAYCKLNEAGYEHFTVIHKYSFKKTYVNTKDTPGYCGSSQKSYRRCLETCQRPFQETVRHENNAVRTTHCRTNVAFSGERKCVPDIL